MDDGNILSRKKPKTSNDDDKGNLERDDTKVDKKKLFNRYLRTYCESDVDIENMTLDERERFFTWRRAVIPREFIEGVVKKECGRLDTNSLIIVSDIVKMFVGEIVTKCLSLSLNDDVDNITREDILDVVNTPKL